MSLKIKYSASSALNTSSFAQKQSDCIKVKQFCKMQIRSRFNLKQCGNVISNHYQDQQHNFQQISTFKMAEVAAEQTDLNPEVLRQFCYTIEGNIGCGKSTFLTLLKERFPQAKWIEEPVSEWQNLGGKNINILEKYYKEPTRWGFTFQIYAIFTRIKALQEACERYPDKIKISERSILADKYVFSQLMKDLGYMDEAEYDVFKSLYSNFETMTNINKTKVIYLRCTPERCHERTKIRKREEQDEIPLEYLKLIHEKHENWFKEHDPKNVLIIDTTEDFKNSESRINEMFSKLKDFLGSE